MADNDAILLWPLPGLVPRPDSNTPATELPDADRNAEATRLFCVIVSSCKSQNRALTIGECSSALADKTGASWGAKWEARHGPLLRFLQQHAVPAVHVITRNRYLSLVGQGVPSIADEREQEAARARAAQAASARAPQAPPTQAPYVRAQEALDATARPPASPAILSPSEDPVSRAAGSWEPFDDSFDTLQDERRRLEHRLEQERLRCLALARDDRLALVAAAQARDEERTMAALRAEAAADDELAQRRKFQEESDHSMCLTIARDEHTRLASAMSDRSATTLTRASSLGDIDAGSGGVGGGGSEDTRTARGALYGALGAESPPPLPPRSQQESAFRPSLSLSIPPPAASLLSRRSIGSGSYAGRGYGSGSSQPPFSSALALRPGSTDGASSGRPTLFDDEGAFSLATTAPADDAALVWSSFDQLFRPLLLHGFTLRKHGRGGGVGRRRFRVDATLATLKWESARLQDLFVGERAIELASVVGVVEGISTDLLRRKLACGEIFGGHANRFFSLVMPDRSVDLEASSSAQAKVLARAFRFLSEARNRGGAMAMGFGGGSPTWR